MHFQLSARTVDSAGNLEIIFCKNPEFTKIAEMTHERVIKIQAGEHIAPETLREISEAIRSGKIITFPTDTVYGIGSSGLIPDAMRRIYEIKGRDFSKPLPILFKSIEETKRWVEWTHTADILALKFWPGPLTLVLEPNKKGRTLLSPRSSTLAVRVPAHPVILSVLKAADVPLASTSANISGQPAITSGDQVFGVLGDMVDFILDAGPVSGIESTVVDATESSVSILREGKLSRDKIMRALKP